MGREKEITKERAGKMSSGGLGERKLLKRIKMLSQAKAVRHLCYL